MIFRPSRKLSVRIKTGTLTTMPLDANPLADWSARVFVVLRKQFVLLCNTTSLYSIVMEARGMTSVDQFVEYSLAGLRDCMKADGFGSAFDRFLAPVVAPVRFATALNRSVTGSMNLGVMEASYDLAGGDLPLFEIGRRLNDTPRSVIGKRHGDYGDPRDTFAALLAAAGWTDPRADC